MSLHRTLMERKSQSDASVWIHTSPRKSSIAKLSMSLQTLPAYLVYRTENGTEQRFDLTKAVCTLGRWEDRDIVLQCPQISKNHASVEKTDYGYIVRDNKSRNGIQLNGEDIAGIHVLQDKDILQLGSIQLEFHDEVAITSQNWRAKAENHPAFASHLETPMKSTTGGLEGANSATAASTSDSLAASSKATVIQSKPAVRRPVEDLFSDDHRQPPRPTSNVLASTRTSMMGASPRDKNIGLVTILPSEKKYEETITVRAELSGDDNDDDFQPAAAVQDPDVLKNDYEKLRLAYELSKIGLTEINDLLEKTLELMFSVLPVDRGVVLLKDRKTGMLTIDKVKLREGKGMENREILLSSTILKRVFETKKSLITMDAFEDPSLGKSESIARGMIRSVICVPLVAHNQVHGIMHLDSQDRLNSFAEKDLALVKAISNQTAIALENCKLLQDIEKELKIRDTLGRFLPPHVVDRCITRGEEPLRRGGRQIEGTILFADIRGFTQMSEKSSPQEVVELLNDFFERLVKIVFKYDGVLDKYIGDCLMAAFGTLPDQEDAVFNAVSAALEFKEAVREMNEERQKQGKHPISIGVGLNTGNLVAGYIGSSQRLEYTCIGDTVNTSSRICSMAQENEVLISEFTYLRVRDRIDAQFHAKKVFKGKSTEVAVYEALGVKI